MLRIRCLSNATLDVKGRLALPAPLRRGLERAEVGNLVLSHYEGAVWGWTPEGFEKGVESRIAGEDQFDPSVMDFVYAVLAVAQDVEVDKAGRVRVPANLRELAGLSKEVMVFSVLDRIEMWDRTKWDARFKRAVEALPAMGGMPTGGRP